MSRVAFDTSVLVAALQSWHEDHERSLAAVADALADPPVVVPHHVLLETYSVLTRLPRPMRLSPDTAVETLRRTLEGKSELVGPPPAEGFALLDRLRDRTVTGGAVYDAAIAETAAKAGADSILTLNRKHFERVKPDGLAIVEP